MQQLFTENLFPLGYRPILHQTVSATLRKCTRRYCNIIVAYIHVHLQYGGGNYCTQNDNCPPYPGIQYKIGCDKNCSA